MSILGSGIYLRANGLFILIEQLLKWILKILFR